MLDTNVAIHLRDGDIEIVDRVETLEGELMLSIISRVELEGGVRQNPSQSVRRRALLDVMLATLHIVDFDQQSAEAYRRIIEAVGFSRRRVLDRMIAAQAMTSHTPLITLNGDDFRDIPGLTLIEW